jgi:hypothetical protein
MTVSNEMLMRFIDGELPPEDAARIEAQIANDPALQRYVEGQRALQRQLADALSPIMAEPVPEHLSAAIRNTPVSWRWRLKHIFARTDGRLTWPTIAVPATAALAAGLAIGMLISPAGIDQITTQKDGTIVASGTLAAALTTRLASEAQPANAPRIGISFRNTDGQDCRTFESGRLAGVACRDATQWKIAALAATAPTAEGPYRQAGSAMPDVIRDAVRGMIAGVPFDAAAERAARDQRWRQK